MAEVEEEVDSVDDSKDEIVKAKLTTNSKPNGKGMR